jgi:hypothetical protein
MDDRTLGALIDRESSRLKVNRYELSGWQLHAFASWVEEQADAELASIRAGVLGDVETE